MHYYDRDCEVLKLTKGKKVLHLGCVGFTELSNDERVQYASKTLHWKLSNECQVVGIDYSVEVIEEYKKLGIFNNILFGDLEELQDLPLNEKFEVIVAGDIIEHLANPGLMLAGVRRFCNPETLLILTTPHAFGLPSYIRYVFNCYRDGEDHVMSFNRDNLRNLLKRYGFNIVRLDTCFHANSRLKTNRLIFAFVQKFLELFPRFGGTLFVQAKLETIDKG